MRLSHTQGVAIGRGVVQCCHIEWWMRLGDKGIQTRRQIGRAFAADDDQRYGGFRQGMPSPPVSMGPGSARSAKERPPASPRPRASKKGLKSRASEASIKEYQTGGGHRPRRQREAPLGEPRARQAGEQEEPQTPGQQECLSRAGAVRLRSQCSLRSGLPCGGYPATLGLGNGLKSATPATRR